MLPKVVGTLHTKRFETFCNSSAHRWTFLGLGNEINNNIHKKITRETLFDALTNKSLLIKKKKIV